MIDTQMIFAELNAAQTWDDYKAVLTRFSPQECGSMKQWLEEAEKTAEQGMKTRFGVALSALAQMGLAGAGALEKGSKVALLWEAARLDAANHTIPGSPLAEVMNSRPLTALTEAAKRATGITRAVIILASVLVVHSAMAQLVVSDPVMALQTSYKNVADGIAWGESFANQVSTLANQMTQIENQSKQISLATEQMKRRGDASSLMNILSVGNLNRAMPLSSFQTGFSDLKTSSNGSTALNDDGNGIYQSISNVSPGGNLVSRNYTTYRQYDMMSKIRQQHENNSSTYVTAAKDLQAQITATLTALDAATTETEIAKQHAKLTALQAQQQVLSDQLHKAALDSTVQANDMAANRQKQQKASAEAYDADAQASLQTAKGATLPQPVYTPVHVN